jgi:hypothetical protein
LGGGGSADEGLERRWTWRRRRRRERRPIRPRMVDEAGVNRQGEGWAPAAKADAGGEVLVGV